jgi:hypothetical protein
MIPFIEREQQETRVFPPMTRALYSPSNGRDLSPDECSAFRVLALAAAPCRGLVRYGWRITPTARLQRLLHFHRAAQHTELAGQAQRADAFWAEVVRELGLLPEHSPAWTDLAADLSREHAALELADALRLRSRLVNEVLIDSLIAWINGHLQGREKLSAATRAADLVAVLERVVAHSGLGIEDRRSLMERAILACAGGLEKAELWDRAIALVAKLVAAYPDRLAYQSHLSNFMYLKAVSKALNTTSESEEASVRQAAALGQSIRTMEAFRVRHPCCPDCYDSLAALHYLRAVKLTNGGRIAQGLAAIEMSLAYRPDAPEVVKARSQLETMMRSLQGQMKATLAQLGTRYIGHNQLRTATLSAKGQELKREADAGFGPRDEYRTGATVKALARARRIACGRQLWERVGLPRPSGDWDALAAQLDEGLALVLARNPKTGADFLRGWADVQSRRPELKLSEFAPETILAFLDHAGLNEAQPSQSPVLATPSDRKFSTGPFDLWLVRPRDLAFKTTVAACLLVLLASGLLTRWAEDGKKRRDEAFVALKAAAAGLDGPAGSAAIGRFLRAPFAGLDGRAAMVRKLQLAALGWPAARDRNAAYDRLMAAAARRDGGGAVTAADEFLKTAQSAEDPRARQVAELRDQVRDWPKLRARNEAYTEVVTASRAGDDRSLLKAGDRFLQAADGSDLDPRTAQVKDLVAQAAEAPNRRARDQAYQRLTELMTAVMGHAAEKDGDALGTAERFLAARPTWGDPDPRKEHVEQIRAVILAAPKRRERDAAYRKITAAARLGEPGEATVLREGAAFAASLPRGDTDLRTEQVARLVDLAREGPNLRRRDDAYSRLLTAADSKDEVAVAKAIAEFRAAKPLKVADPRSDQMDRAERMAAEWPGRRQRDGAYARLKALASAADDPAVLDVAEQFLQARPKEGEDPRTEQVRQRYDAAFVRWFAIRPEEKEAQERVNRYKNLTAQPTR